MKSGWTRRALLTSAASVLGSAALANAPLTSLRPVARIAEKVADIPRVRPQARKSLDDIIAASGLQGQVGFVMADAATGRVLEAVDPTTPMPPASVTKAVTALYAIEGLGPDFTFPTSVYATGPVIDGVLEGDLVLAGGGDPNLLTDDLKALAAAMKDTGLTEVRGDFLVYGAALPGLDEIDESQLDHLGYNPSISGLNLNFNRVYFEWKRTGGDYAVSMDARSETVRPTVTVARMRIVDRNLPIYAYRDAGDVDEWTVARRALGNAGSRWLPVRNPALYAGDVFRTFARSEGIVLKTAKRAKTAPDGTLLAQRQSPELQAVMRSMLRFSTNITAEVAGMMATKGRTGQRRGLRTSALGMTRWTATRAPIAPVFVDHSGLGDASRISAGDMVDLLTADGVRDLLRPIMKVIAMRDDARKVIKDHPAEVRAKTGTLNFVSTLAGYLTTASGDELAFAIFAADLDARERGKASGDEQPSGSITFNTRAKKLQQILLQRWGNR